MTQAIDKAQNVVSSDALTRSGWSDERLLLEYRQGGDSSLFRELVNRYEREIYNYLRRYLGNPDLAEDAFQATFLQLHLKCGQFEKGRNLRPWLYMIATNQAIDLQRRTKRHRMVSLDRLGSRSEDDAAKLADLLVSQEPNPIDRIDSDESQLWVREALHRLPEYLRLAVNLVYFQGLKYREAAEVLSIPVGTVKSRLHAAILKLNDAWTSAHSSDK